MSEASVIHSTFVLERSYPQAPEAVFAAFADPAKKRRWFGGEAHHAIDEFELDFRVGGDERVVYRMGDNTPFPGVPLSNESKYLEIVPNQTIVAAMAMDLGGRRISAALLTIQLAAKDGGTEMICTHQGVYFEGSGGPEMREMGWRHLFVELGTELARA